MRTRSLLQPRATQLDAALRLWGTPGCSREELLDDQSEKLRTLVRFAQQKIPYYTRLFAEAALDANEVRSAGDLHRIPVSSKLQLREVPRSDLMPPGVDPDRLLPDRSSGSSGIKLLLWREPFERHLLQLYRMRAWLLLGVRLRDRLATLGGSFSFKGPQPDLVSRLRQALEVFRGTQVSSNRTPEEILEQLVALQPDILIGYPGVVHEVARTAERLGETRFRPRIVIPGGEALTPPMKETIAGALDTTVFSTYGAMEFNLLSWECPETGLQHVNEDALVLEVLRNGEPVEEGNSGEVVVTGLHSYVFPLIRYRLGDLATRGPTPCPCGAPFATLGEIRGRTVEYYVRGDGSLVHHWELSQVLYRALPNMVARYQIVQELDGRIIYRLMPLGEIPAEVLAEAQRRGARLLGGATSFEVRVEDEIPCAPSGKMMQSVNQLRPTQGRDAWDPAFENWD